MTAPIRLASWTYHCDEQDADYDLQLQYDVHPAELSLGVARNVEVLGVHEVLSGSVNIEGQPVRLEPGDWEARVQSRIETRLAKSDPLRRQAEEACWKDLDEFREKFIA